MSPHDSGHGNVPALGDSAQPSAWRMHRETSLQRGVLAVDIFMSLMYVSPMTARTTVRLPEPLRLPFYNGERTILKRDAMFIRVTADNGLKGYAPGPAHERAA